jgi:hypothetical protein
MRTSTRILVVTGAFLLAGCSLVPSRPNIRADLTECPSVPASSDSIAQLNTPNSTPEVTSSYELLFIEFDDQGWLFPPKEVDSRFGDAGRQLEFTMARLQCLARQESSGGLDIFVFVHGWKHGARDDDCNVREFKKQLTLTAHNESLDAASSQRRPHRIVGIYVSWRGLSVQLREPFPSVTFWSRKFAAQHVSQGTVRELFVRLRSFWRKQQQCAVETVCRPGHLIIVGHSFGALIVFSAISESLIDTLVGVEGGTDFLQRDARFGDLVVLINPAFEASRYEPVYDLARVARKWDGPPLLVSVTSEADWATRLAFPIGRRVNTVWEKHASAAEEDANHKTIGHIDRYLTHQLFHCANDGGKACEALAVGECRNLWLKPRTAAGPQREEPLVFKSPVWNVRTTKDIVKSHDDIWGPDLQCFLQWLYSGAKERDRSRGSGGSTAP